MADKKKKKLSNTDRFVLLLFLAAVVTTLLYMGRNNPYVYLLLSGIPGRTLFGTSESAQALTAAAEFSLVVFGTLFVIRFKPKKKDTKEKLGGDIMGTSRWMTQKEINETFPRIAFSDLHKTKVNGFVIASQIAKDGETYVNYKGGVHCLAIGTTGSGKTSRFVLPTLHMLARSKSKPSVVISDPKSELYEKTSKTFQDNGYKIICINLRDVIDKSDCWNPCYRAWKYYQEALNQKSTVKKVTGIEIKKLSETYTLTVDASEYGNEVYIYNNMAFASMSDVEIEIARNAQQLIGKASDEIGDIVNTLFPEKDPKDAYWVNSARSIVAGILLGMLEDSENPELGMTQSTYNLATVAANLSLNPSTMIDYFDMREPTSLAKQRAKTTLNAGGETRGTILSTVQTGLYPFTESDIQYCTCQNDIDLEEVGMRPCAVYLIVPDEKENRHVFASLFINQMYKALIDLASHSPKNELPHPVNFILDEFANIPMIPGMDNKITVSRSRGIFFLLIVQGLNQLKQKYGEIGDTIKDNCNLIVYLATNDNETAEYFSKLCGNKTMVTKSESSTKGKDKSTSTSSSLASEPLIRPEELLRNQQGEAIVKMLGCQPAKTKQAKFWESRYNTTGEAVDDEKWNRDVFIFSENGFYNLETTIHYAEEKAKEERRKKLQERSAPKVEDKPKAPSAPAVAPAPIKFEDDDEDFDDDEELASIKAFLDSLEIKDEEPEPSLVPIVEEKEPIKIAEEQPIFVAKEEPKPIAKEEPFVFPEEKKIVAPVVEEEPVPVVRKPKAKPSKVSEEKNLSTNNDDAIGVASDLSNFFGINKKS